MVSPAVELQSHEVIRVGEIKPPQLFAGRADHHVLDLRPWEARVDEESLDEAVEVAVGDGGAVVLLEDRSQWSDAPSTTTAVTGKGVQQVVPRAEASADGVVDRLLQPLWWHDGAEVDEGSNQSRAWDRQSLGGVSKVERAGEAATSLVGPHASGKTRNRLRPCVADGRFAPADNASSINVGEVSGVSPVAVAGACRRREWGRGGPPGACR